MWRKRRRRIQTHLYSLSLALLLVGCHRGVKREISEGIRGRVEIWEGDFMPPSTGKIYYAKKTILIFHKTHLKDATPESGSSTFYTALSTPLVDSVISDKAGYFSKRLPPGEYSLFVREKGIFYANMMDGEGFILPVKVEKGKVSEVNIRIDYKATY